MADTTVLYVGSSQTYKTINDAMAAAKDGDTIIVKGSEYTDTTERVIIDKSVTLQAEGTVTVDSFGVGCGSAKPNDVTIKGFTFVTKSGNYNSTYAGGIWQAGTNLNSLTVEDCTFDLTAPTSGVNTYGIYFSLNFCGMQSLKLTNNTFEGNYVPGPDTWSWAVNALRMAYQTGVEITDNTFSGFYGHAIQVTADGPRWVEDEDGKHPDYTECKYIVSGNTITDCGCYGIYVDGIKNYKTSFEITDNYIANVNNSNGAGAIVLVTGSAYGANISGNIIEGTHIGINTLGFALHEDATGEFIIENNAIAYTDKVGTGKYTPNGITGTNVPTNATTENLIVEGDEIVCDTSVNTLYVNADWAGKETGTNVVANGKLVQIGTNAFAEVNDEVRKLVADGVAKEVVLAAGEYDKMAFDGNVIVKADTTGDEVVQFDLVDNNDKNSPANTVTFASGNFFFTGKPSGTVFNPNDTYIVKSGATVGVAGQYMKSTILVEKGGVMNLQAMQNTVNPFTVKGIVNISDSGTYAKLAGNDNGTSGSMIIDGKDGEGIVNVAMEGFSVAGGYNARGWIDNLTTPSTLTITDGGLLKSNALYFRNGKQGTITIEKNSSMIFTSKDAKENQGTIFAERFDGQNMSGQTGNDGVIKVLSGSTLDLRGDLDPFVNAGTIEVNSASMLAKDITNNGTITVRNTSTINATISGNAVTVANGATLFDSNIVGTIQVQGNLNFSGDNSVKTLRAVNGGRLTIEDGKVLTLTNFSFGSLDTAGKQYTISGGKIVADYGFFQHGKYTLESDFETGYMYYSYGSDITLKGNFHSKGAGDGLDYVRGKLTIAAGGSSTHDKSLWVGQPESWGAMKASLTVIGSLEANNLNVYAGSSMTVNGGTVTVGKLTNTGTITIKGNSTINATISGNVAQVAKGAVITVVDSAFKAGVDSYTMKLDVYNLANLKSINGVAVAGNATAGYSIKINDVLYTIADANADGLVFTAVKDDEGNASDSIEITDYTGSLDGLTSDYVLEAKSGTATLKVNKGQSSTVTAITKDENGGVTNLNLNGNLTLGTKDDHGSVEAVGKITTGSDVDVKLGDVSGTNLNSTISLGKKNEAIFDNIDLKGGNNTLSIGANSYVEVDDSDNDNADGFIKNVKTIKLASGKKDDETKLNVTGDIIAPAMANTITLGNYAKLDVAGNLVNDDVNVGTTIKAGNYSEVLFGKPDVNGNITGGKVTSLAGLTLGTEGVFKAASVSGTSGNNTISFGNNAKAKVKGDINLLIGKDTIKAGTGADVEVSGDVKGVETISLGNYAKLFVDGNLLNDGVNIGTTIKAGNYSEVLFGKPDGNGNITGGEVTSLAGLTLGTEGVFKAASVSGTEKNNTVSLGKNADMFVVGEINLGGGKDTIKLGNETEFTAASITGVETITIGAKGSFTAAGDITGVNKLTAANGTYTKKTDETVWTEVTAGNVTGTEKNDTVSFGKYNDIELASLDLGAGNDTVKIGVDSIVNLNAVDFGDGKDTMTIGKDAKVKVTSIEGLETLNASKGASIWFAGGADVDVDLTGIGGSWKNATIFDDMGEIADGAECNGAVYGNEWDIYELTDGISSVVIESETNSDAIYRIYEIGAWDKAVAEITDITRDFINDLDTGKDYVLAVSVAGADFKNKENDTNKYSFDITLA